MSISDNWELFVCIKVCWYVVYAHIHWYGEYFQFQQWRIHYILEVITYMTFFVSHGIYAFTVHCNRTGVEIKPNSLRKVITGTASMVIKFGNWMVILNLELHNIPLRFLGCHVLETNIFKYPSLCLVLLENGF